VNWFVANWPEIKHTVEDLYPVWNILGKLIEQFANLFVIAMKVVEGSLWVLGKMHDGLQAIGDAANWAVQKTKDLAIALGGHTPLPGGGTGGGGGGNITAFAAGGTVSGPIGAPQLIIAHGGERVLTPHQQGISMDDTNEVLAAIHGMLARIEANTRGPQFGTRAYGQ
jgi:hypothetical protein